MRWRSRIARLFFLVLVLGAQAFGCRAPSRAPAPQSKASPPAIRVTDSLGYELRLPAAPQRIVSLSPGNTEILFALGLGDRVVGVTEFCNYPREAAALPKVGGFKNPNIEQIVALRPDLVVASRGDRLEDILVLRRAKVPVFAVEATSLEDVFSAIEAVGEATGSRKQAQRLVSSLRHRVQAVERRVAAGNGKRPRGLVLLAEPANSVFVAGKGSFVDDLIRLAGGENVGAALPLAWAEMSLEAIVAADPQVLVLTTGSHLTSAQEKDNRLGRMAGWKGLSAVRDGRMYSLPADPLLRPGPRLIDMLEAMARLIHPGSFPR